MSAPQKDELVARKGMPNNIGRVWDDEVGPKGTIYINWLDRDTLQVVPVADLVLLTDEERAAYEIGRAL